MGYGMFPRAGSQSLFLSGWLDLTGRSSRDCCTRQGVAGLHPPPPPPGSQTQRPPHAAAETRNADLSLLSAGKRCSAARKPEEIRGQ